MKSAYSTNAAIIMAGSIALSSTLYASAEPTPAELIDALNNVFGLQAGTRSSHAKAFCASGQFTPASTASTLIASSLFSQQPVSATFRFSIGGGNPAISDKSRSVRGIAIKLESDDETYSLALVSEPVFFAATPASFVSFLQARIPDPDTKKPNPEKVKQHSAQYPESKLLGQLLADHAAPASYATTPYHSNHAFHFRNSHGEGRWARVIVEPDAGIQYLTASEELTLPDHFLKDELQNRLTIDTISYTLYIQEATATDSLTDPTQLWNSSGPRHKVGKLEVSAIIPDTTCDIAIFLQLSYPKV